MYKVGDRVQWDEGNGTMWAGTVFSIVDKYMVFVHWDDGLRQAQGIDSIYMSLLDPDYEGYEEDSCF